MKKMKNLIKKYKLYYLLLLPVIYVVFYLNTSSSALPEVESYLKTTELVMVSLGDVIEFTPIEANNKGIIFYPGGKVDPKAYAPMLFRLAEEGYTCYLVKMPFNLAVFNPDAGRKIIEAHPEIKDWTIGGHSLGGAMASKQVFDHPNLYKRIFFLAAYPIDSTALTEIESLSSLSIYGENDGLVNLERIAQDQLLLPKDQTVYILTGGNHAQFGYYGLQKGDLEPTIDRAKQQEMVLTQLKAWLDDKNPKQ